MSNGGTAEAVNVLRSPQTIRERAQRILTAAKGGSLEHFAFHPEQMEAAAAYICDVIKANYPDLKIPYHSRWRHFSVGNIERVAVLDESLKDTWEKARAMFDLAIVSVLLDAGAGEKWHYQEASTGQTFSRSEGLAVASWHMFAAGLFSDQAQTPWQVTANGLQKLTLEQLAAGMHVSKSNPLAGLEGRLTLLKTLGKVIEEQPQVFNNRLGKLFDHCLKFSEHESLAADQILRIVLEVFANIWPSRFSLGQDNLGDVWQHRFLKTNDLTSGYMPFHKLSQWLTYSLFEPIEAAGFTIRHMDRLTGLTEYRNGGLWVDLEVITPNAAKAFATTYTPDMEFIVEWRALTVALLDEVAPLVRQALHASAEAMPLAKILEGGTWAAGRLIAKEKRPGGGPPFNIVSDGTLF